jgi:hypothetical protein
VRAYFHFDRFRAVHHFVNVLVKMVVMVVGKTLARCGEIIRKENEVQQHSLDVDGHPAFLESVDRTVRSSSALAKRLMRQ